MRAFALALAKSLPPGQALSRLGRTNWMRCLRDIGYKTTSISSFGERHCAWHWYAGFNEVFNNGKGGMEIASEVSPIAEDWLRRNGAEDNWFLHLNFWDPHTPYRTPDDYGNPFEDEIPYRRGTRRKSAGITGRGRVRIPRRSVGGSGRSRNWLRTASDSPQKSIR